MIQSEISKLIRFEVIEMKGSTLEERILLKRVLEDNKEPVCINRCNIGGIMLSNLWETNSYLVWSKLAFSSSKWQNVNETFKATINIKDFIEKYKTL